MTFSQVIQPAHREPTGTRRHRRETAQSWLSYSLSFLSLCCLLGQTQQEHRRARMSMDVLQAGLPPGLRESRVELEGEMDDGSYWEF